MTDLRPLCQTLRQTPSQTAGPYLHIGMTPGASGLTGIGPEHGSELGASMKTGPVQGHEIILAGVIHDGTGTPLKDALVEIWQPDHAGRFAGHDPQADPHFTGWGRAAVDPQTGRFAFDTVRPGPVAWPGGGMQAPHITLWIIARGINCALQTRAYFADLQDANARDPILTRIEHQCRVPTLLAQPDENGYCFDIHLQGPHETIFFDI